MTNHIRARVTLGLNITFVKLYFRRWKWKIMIRFSDSSSTQGCLPKNQYLLNTYIFGNQDRAFDIAYWQLSMFVSFKKLCLVQLERVSVYHCAFAFNTGRPLVFSNVGLERISWVTESSHSLAACKAEGVLYSS